MKVAVTGANGFLGSHVLRRLLARGDAPVALVRPGANLRWIQSLDLETREIDLLDRHCLVRALEGVEVVLHLAGATRARPTRRFFGVNVGGTRALIEACPMARPGVQRVVLSSSLAAVGPASSRLPLTENQPALPVGAYGESKWLAEQALLASPHVEGVVLRPTAIYGPRDVDVLQMLQMARLGVHVRLGFRSTAYNWLYASDAADAFVQACLAPTAAGEIFHLGDATNYSPAESDRIIAEALGVPVRVTLPLPLLAVRAAALVGELLSLGSPRPPTLNRDKAKILTAGSWAVDIDKARALLGWEPRHTLLDGMTETIGWYRRKGWLR